MPHRWIFSVLGRALLPQLSVERIFPDSSVAIWLLTGAGDCLGLNGSWVSLIIPLLMVTWLSPAWTVNYAKPCCNIKKCIFGVTCSQDSCQRRKKMQLLALKLAIVVKWCRCSSVVEHSIRNRTVSGSNPLIGFNQELSKIRYKGVGVTALISKGLH